MKISVKVHPKSKVESIAQVAENEFELYFNVAPEKGKANEKVIEMISDYFGIAKSSVVIVTGHKSTKKIIEILQ